MHADLDSRLRHLRLSGMAATLPARNQEAVHNNLAPRRAGCTRHHRRLEGLPWA